MIIFTAILPLVNKYLGHICKTYRSSSYRVIFTIPSPFSSIDLMWKITNWPPKNIELLNDEWQERAV